MKTKNRAIFVAANLNPVLSVAKNGTVLYSNAAGEPLLHEWGVEEEKSYLLRIENIVHRVISETYRREWKLKPEKEYT